MTMKERMARVILKRRFYDCEPDMYGHDLERFFAEIDPQHMHDARDEVEAVLDALYEPTPGMIAAFDRHCDDSGQCLVKTGWRTMIDHIRSEDKT